MVFGSPNTISRIIRGDSFAAPNSSFQLFFLADGPHLYVGYFIFLPLHLHWAYIFFRKDGKSFAAISIRRWKKKKGKCPPVFWAKTGSKNHTTQESAPLVLATLVQQLNNYHNSPHYFIQLDQNDPTKQLNYQLTTQLNDVLPSDTK